MRRIELALAVCIASTSFVSTTCQAGDVETSLDNLTNQLLAGIEFEGEATLAVVPFEARGSYGTDAGRAIAEYVVAGLQNDTRLRLVDRIQFSNAMKEIALSQTGAIDEQGALAVGKALAARYLITGTISDAIGKNMINARLVEAETARIVASARVSLEPGSLTSFSKELLGEKGQLTASLFRSMVVPGWGQFYTSHVFRGVLSLGAFLAAGGVTGYSIAKTAGKAGDYEDFTESIKSESFEDNFRQAVCPNGCPQDEFNDLKGAHSDSLFDVYGKQKGKAAIAGIITGAFWALNLVDASIAGARSRKKLKLYFAVMPDAAVHSGIVWRF